jgi:hypothetical protein
MLFFPRKEEENKPCPKPASPPTSPILANERVVGATASRPREKCDPPVLELTTILL